MQIIFDENADKAAIEIYDLIKTALQVGEFKLSHVEMIAELTTELAARKKEEES